MALIEGVGDEVTILFALVLLFTIVVLAWISTHTVERSGSHWTSSTEQRVADSSHSSADPTHYSADPTHSSADPTHSCADHPLNNSPHPSAPSDSAGGGAPPLAADCPQESPLGATNREAPNLRHRGPGARAEEASAGGPDSISLRLKFLNDTERVVSVCPSDSILHIKRTHFPGEESRVRLIYQGQLLRDDSQTVASLQLTNGCVLHCHISQHASLPGHGSAELPEVPLNIGSLLVPLLVLILALLWYSKFQYPHVFTATATVCLAAITLLATVIACATYRT